MRNVARPTYLGELFEVMVIVAPGEDVLDEPREEDQVREGKGRGKSSRGNRTQQKPTFHRDVLDGKAKDDGPDHAQGHLHIPIHNFYRNNG